MGSNSLDSWPKTKMGMIETLLRSCDSDPSYLLASTTLPQGGLTMASEFVEVKTKHHCLEVTYSTTRAARAYVTAVVSSSNSAIGASCPYSFTVEGTSKTNAVANRNGADSGCPSQLRTRYSTSTCQRLPPEYDAFQRHE